MAAEAAAAQPPAVPEADVIEPMAKTTREATAAKPDQPAGDDPLSRLRIDLARIEEDLHALDALKLPKFLQPQNFVWPFLLLGGGVGRLYWPTPG